MTKERIRFLVGLMCVAMLGFIAFQWYIIRESVTVRNDQFNLRVAESVQTVVHRLEKEEMIYLLLQRIEMEQQRSKLQMMTMMQRNEKSKTAHHESAGVQPRADTIRTLASSSTATLPRNNDSFNSDVLIPNFNKIADYHARIIEEFFQAQHAGMAGIDEFVNRRMQDDLELDYFFEDNNSSIARRSVVPAGIPRELIKENDKKEKDKKDLRRQIQIPNARSNQQIADEDKISRADILKDVMKDLIHTKRPIEERVNRFLLDSMLKREFQQNGINLPYEFAVKGNLGNQLMFTTVQYSVQDWDKNAYKTVLFPNETAGSLSQLYVYFPGKNKFVLGTMTALLLGSGFMAMAIILIFYIAIATILKQKKLSEMKNDFINNMTHEFKTPISTISLAVDMAKESLSDHYQAPNQGIRYLEIIKEENKRLGGHVEKVLQTALVDRGEVKLKLTDVDVHEVLLKVLESFTVVVEQRNGEIVLDFEAGNDVIIADEVHLSGVIRNLVDNAIKYSPDELFLKIATKNTDNGFNIIVEDHGIGISKDQQERIYDKFYRVSTGDRHDVKGFGLGLSYVKEMVHLHKGKISVSSKTGEGSIFTVWFPQSTKS